jgi:hypothetical protein
MRSSLLSSCVTGAALIDEVEQMLQAAGFTAIRIQPKDESKRFIREWVPDTKIEDYLPIAAVSDGAGGARSSTRALRVTAVAKTLPAA